LAGVVSSAFLLAVEGRAVLEVNGAEEVDADEEADEADDDDDDDDDDTGAEADVAVGEGVVEALELADEEVCGLLLRRTLRRS